MFNPYYRHAVLMSGCHVVCVLSVQTCQVETIRGVEDKFRGRIPFLYRNQSQWCQGLSGLMCKNVRHSWHSVRVHAYVCQDLMGSSSLTTDVHRVLCTSPLSPHELSNEPSVEIKLLRQDLLQCWSFSLLAMLLPHFLVNSNCMENRAVSMLNGLREGWVN